MKAPHLESLKICGLGDTTKANRSQLMEFVGLAAANSSCLNTLYFQSTRSSAEDGEKLMQVLADLDLDSLKQLTIELERDWFRHGQDMCMAPLLILLAR